MKIGTKACIPPAISLSTLSTDVFFGNDGLQMKLNALNRFYKNVIFRQALAATLVQPISRKEKKKKTTQITFL